jgi:arylsulfatase A-like enzyme
MKYTFFLLLAVCAMAKPNVLFLLSDDQRPDTIAALGNPHIQTPAVDSLVKRGFVFHNTYCMGSMSGAVCAPSRAMINTGRSLWHNPIGFNVPWSGPKDRRGITPHITMPKHFRNAGYATFCTGKWHQEVPAFSEGFTHGGNIFFGGMGKHVGLPVTAFADFAKGKSGATPNPSFSSTAFADAAIEFLDSRGSASNPKEKPFYMYVSFTAPHDPRTPPKEYRDRYDASKLPLPANYLPEHPFNNGELRIRDEKLAKWPRTEAIVREELAKYYAMITQMDDQIGRILAALDASGEADNTVIVFTSDHGLAIGSHGLMGKQNLYEHSMKAPLVIAGPGVRKGESQALTYLFDLFPTLSAMSDLPIPESVEGKSLLPILRGKRAAVRDSIFLAYRGIQRSVRSERWKLIEYAVKGLRTSQLFDLVNDPHELKNLADSPEHNVVVQRLARELLGWQERLDDPDAKNFARDQ